MLKKLFRLIYLSALIILATSCATTPARPYDVRADQLPQVKKYIKEMAANYNFDKKQLTYLFSQVNIHYEPIKKISKPAEAEPWYVYRRHLVTPQRIKDGVAYWNAHRTELAAAEKKYGVEQDIIVAIIGVETNYGTNKGKFSVFGALTTLAFGYPARAAFFKSELTSFLLQMRTKEINPLEFKGSYAGAFGIPQFMPSSYGAYAVSYSGFGAPDIINNHKDAIMSVANYFTKHGWQYQQPVVARATVAGSSYKSLVQPGLKPKLTVGELASAGIKPLRWVSPQEKARFMIFAGEQGPEYFLGFNNFAAIQRYNSSSNYAMAVYDLAQEIRKQKLGR